MGIPIRRPFVLLLRPLLLLAAAAALSAQTGPARRIDEILQSWRTTPGASVAVIRNGNLVFAKGYGIANLEYGAPITPGTVFHVASVSKQFTAMCIVLLEQDGKLSIENIHRCLPDCPTTAIRSCSATCFGARRNPRPVADPATGRMADEPS